MENLEDHQLDQVVKVSMTSSKQIDLVYLHLRYTEKSHHFYGIPNKGAWPEWWGNIRWTKGKGDPMEWNAHARKTIRDTKDKERLELLQIEGDYEIWQQNTTYVLG